MAAKQLDILDGLASQLEELHENMMKSITAASDAHPELKKENSTQHSNQVVEKRGDGCVKDRWNSPKFDKFAEKEPRDIDHASQNPPQEYYELFSKKHIMPCDLLREVFCRK